MSESLHGSNIQTKQSLYSSTIQTKQGLNGSGNIQPKQSLSGKSNVGNTIKGEDGATFIPSIDSDGNLSWSNDKGLSNPEMINIQGPKGDTGETGPRGPQGIPGTAAQVRINPQTQMWEYANEYDAQDNPIWITSDIKASGEKGDPGDQGIQGIQGPKGDTGAVGVGIKSITITEV